MNGVHDMGGMHGFGPVVREADEPVFHAAWERRVAGMMMAAFTQRLFNVDMMRNGIERMEPARYLAASYYERWLASLEHNLLHQGVIAAAELAERQAAVAAAPDAPLPRHDDPALSEAIRARRTARPRERERQTTPAFTPGDAVRARNVHPHTHTRLPRYVRGKRGVIEAVRGEYLLPDTNAHGLGADPRTVYTVRFDGRELWGESAEPNQTLCVDLWEPYLERT
jgi:nitrile hydratase subunit beta